LANRRDLRSRAKFHAGQGTFRAFHTFGAGMTRHRVPAEISIKVRKLRVLAIAIGAASCLPAVPSTRAAEPQGTVVAQDKQPSTDAGSSGNLSERLNQSGGVIKPPENVDPGMQKPPPESSGKMPVIPPPGSPGGDPNVKPK
jgi:hypothetical protein